MEKWFVKKRDGRKEELQIDKIESYIRKFCIGLTLNIEIPRMIKIESLNDGLSTIDLTKNIANWSASNTSIHIDFGILATRIFISTLYKETPEIFSDGYYTNTTPMISDYHKNIIQKYSSRLNASINHDNDLNYNYFGLRTLERSYLLKILDELVERPQHMLMRIAIGIHGSDIDAAIEIYNLLSQKFVINESPTIFLAATPKPQLSPCSLLTILDDSIEGIYETLEKCAKILKSSGSIGLSIQSIRAKGSYIAGSNSTSNGLVPMLRVFNNTARHVNQGRFGDGDGDDKPIGSIAIYLEPWHPDIFDFLNLRKKTGAEETRARDLFYGLWIPDLFMRRVESNGKWSLMCPHECPGLIDLYGQEFDELYEKYEAAGCYVRCVNAQEIWFSVIEAQVETGMPYILYKDACNRKSNQKNLGTICCSNFSTEIIQCVSTENVGVCNLASIALNMFVQSDKKSYDFKKLKEITKIVTRNLNKVIDVNYYSMKEAKNFNMKTRPIGIGVQGLADAFILMRLSYESVEAKLLNQQIFETLYYGALEASCELAKEFGPYETYVGSPASQGILQYDMCGVIPTELWNWAELKETIAKHGVRNSLLIALMPTTPSSKILGNNESFEPLKSNIYNNHVNEHLINDLIELKLWNDDMCKQIFSLNGSIQFIKEIPPTIRDLYKTVWEISVKTQIQLAADRGAFIDQSQSFNIYLTEPTYGKMTSIHFYGWKNGLKTGMYYLRTRRM